MPTVANTFMNPGNLKDPNTGQFRSFSSPREGYAALLNDLQSKMTGTTTTGIGPNSTLYHFAKVYAPASDKNNPAQYAADLANQLGVRPDTTLRELQPRIGEFAKAISINEGYVSSIRGAQTSVTPAKSTFWQQLWGGAKSVGKFGAGAEIGTGEIVAAGIGSSGQIKSMAQFSDQEKNFVNNARQIIQQYKSQGKDTSRIEAMLREIVGTPTAGSESYFQALKKSNLEVGLDVGGVAADVLTAGTYGKAVAAAKTGELFVKALPTALSVGGKAIERAAIGKEGMKTLEQIGNKEAKKFAEGKTFGQVVKNTEGAIQRFVESSKAALQKVKSEIPKILIKSSEVATRVNQAIMDSLKKNAAYRGVAQDVSLFKSPKELIRSGLLNPDEERVVNGIIKTISKWGDNSARGILNLKEQLSVFYKEGFGNSNAILTGIQRGLKDLVAEAHPPIRSALEKASSNIDKAEEFSRNLVGRDAVSGESKLRSLARGLKDPTINAEKIKLLNELKSLTGYDALPELKGYADFQALFKKAGGEISQLPTRMGTVLKKAGTRLGIAAGGGIAYKQLKDLFFSGK